MGQDDRQDAGKMVAMNKWSVSIQAEGDRPVELDEVVALADAVAGLGGITSGVGALAMAPRSWSKQARQTRLSIWPSRCLRPRLRPPVCQRGR